MHLKTFSLLPEKLRVITGSRFSIFIITAAKFLQPPSTDAGCYPMRTEGTIMDLYFLQSRCSSFLFYRPFLLSREPGNGEEGLVHFPTQEGWVGLISPKRMADLRVEKRPAAEILLQVKIRFWRFYRQCPWIFPDRGREGFCHCYLPRYVDYYFFPNFSMLAYNPGVF